MPRLDPLLRELAKHETGTLILDPGCKPQLSVDGTQREISRAVLQSEQIAVLVQETGPTPSAARFCYILEGQGFDFDVTQDNGTCRVQVTRSRAEAVDEPTAPAVAEVPAPVQEPGVTDEVTVADEPASVQESGVTNEVTVADESAAVEATAAAAAAERLPEISELLDVLITRSGSDLHLSSKQKPRMRIHGDLLELQQYRPPRPKELKERLWKVTPERGRREFDEKHDTDFALELPGQARFRVNLFEDRAGIGAVFRQIPYEIPTFEQLNLPEILRSLTQLTKGLVLVTGPTGSGKSTTLAALVDQVNESRRDHILTIEDPIEFVHSSKWSLVHQREPGIHTLSFGQALRAALREDPDVILVGEMRDLETIAIAIETAETGHLVFGTLHTTTAPSTVERIVDQFPGDRQEQVRMMLADSLRAVVSQTLLKRIEGGRVAAFEILICTPAVANLIREGKTFQIASAMQTGRKVGMMTQTDSLYELVKRKIVAPEEAYLKAADKAALRKKLETDDVSVNQE